MLLSEPAVTDVTVSASENALEEGEGGENNASHDDDLSNEVWH